MPVYNPIKPSLPKDEFRTYNKRKIFFVGISAILIIGSIILLYMAFRPSKSATSTQPQTEQKPASTEVPAGGQTTEKKAETTNPSGQTYKVESGDTLFAIGQKFNVDWHDIAKANNLKEPYSLRVGQELVIPAKITTQQ